MSPFWSYTLARLGLFAVTYAVFALAVFGLGLMEFGDTTNLLVLFLALVVSSVVSFFTLARQREALALRLQERAEKVQARIEESRRAEDVD
ncbi:MAG: DUF4229 domain-containing protein [Aeromicrobium sp.]|uniref:DUF4229 domain-containing protein n=1 Tax=Aeromicrobium sp. TaxID=1871063 RepID=UPI0039E5244B